MECILGADFLVKHSAVIDCKANTLVLGKVRRITVPISIALNETSPPLLAQAEKVVSMIDTVVIPPRSITQLVAEVQVGCGQEGLIEPLNRGGSSHLRWVVLEILRARSVPKIFR